MRSPSDSLAATRRWPTHISAAVLEELSRPIGTVGVFLAYWKGRGRCVSRPLKEPAHLVPTRGVRESYGPRPSYGSTPRPLALSTYGQVLEYSSSLRATRTAVSVEDVGGLSFDGFLF